MFKMLIDTCLWLDLAKDHQQQATLVVLEELIRQEKVSLILPRIVLDEFQRNKTRVIEESGRSLSSVLKRVKEAVDKFGDPKRKRLVLGQLNELDYKIPSLGGAVVESVSRMEELFKSAPVIETSDDVKLRAAQRAIDRKAPFHRQRNGIDDAILIEIYADVVRGTKAAGTRFAFVTHNTKDFSHPNANNKLPHPDIAAYFSRIKSLYFIGLADALRRVEPRLVSEAMIEEEWIEQPRRLTEIVDAMSELLDKLWYGRHQSLVEAVESGKTKIVKEETFPVQDHQRRPIQRDIWEGARKAAKRVEKQYGVKNLGPWDDFEWGMLSGKLSALRWVLGDEWDNLDT
jgi:hypothetical protein